MEKRFFDWIQVKSDIHYNNVRRSFRDGEIWWCGMGENVGVEINGKDSGFARPILVLKKLSNMGFMGIPLTSQYHEGAWYVAFEFCGEQQYAVLAQARVISVKRLYRKMGEIDEQDLTRIKIGFGALYC